MTRITIERVAKMIYIQWSAMPEYVPWVDGGNSHKQDEARCVAREIIDAACPPAPAAVPPGMALVPIEPTPEMLRAAHDVFGNSLSKRCYSQMIAAAGEKP